MTEPQPPKLSGVLIMPDGIIRVPVVPPPAKPATGGQVAVDIPYPEGIPEAMVTGVMVVNETLGLGFRRMFDTREWRVIRPGDTLHMSFGADDIIGMIAQEEPGEQQ